MNVHLNPELEQLVQAKVQSGRYNSTRETMSPYVLMSAVKEDVVGLTRYGRQLVFGARSCGFSAAGKSTRSPKLQIMP
jgi:hypothetical protein